MCGTSTGGILAVALALKQMSLEDCEQIYRWPAQHVPLLHLQNSSKNKLQQAASVALPFMLLGQHLRRCTRREPVMWVLDLPLTRDVSILSLRSLLQKLVRLFC